MFTLSDRGGSSNRRSSGRSGGTEGTTSEDATSEDVEDNAPLFYCPGKRGFYSPRQGKASYERLNAFRNVGRYGHFFSYLKFRDYCKNIIDSQ